MLEQSIGETAAHTLTDEKVLPLVAASAAAALAAGALFSVCVGACWLKFIASRPKYHAVEEVKLVYEGDEEETVALRSAGDGMMSVMNVGGYSPTWIPRKACGVNASCGGTSRAMGTWG